MVSATLVGEYSLASVKSSVFIGYALRGPLSVALRADYAIRTGLAKGLAAKYNIRAAQPVVAGIVVLYSAFDPAAEFVPSISATVGGQAIDLVACTISANEDSYCLSADIEVADSEAWSLCTAGASLVISVGEDEYNFLIDTRSRSRSWGAIEYKATARSKASRLDAPYAAPISRTWTATTAKTVAQDVCDAAGITLDWRLCDWPLAKYEAAKLTPLAILNSIKTEAAALQSTPAGGLVVRWRYPISPTRYAAASVDLELSDFDDVTKLDDQTDYKPGYNTVYVLEDQSAATNEINLVEWRGVANDETFAPLQKCVAVFTRPYVAVTLETSCPATITAEGLKSFSNTETVEFVAGKASLSYAPDSITSYSWLCANLGAITVSGRTVTAATAGESLLRVTYRASYQRFLVETNVKQKCQVKAVVEWPEVTDSGLFKVVRDPGDRPAPDVIVDALCTTAGIKTERGRNYLDAEGFSKERYEASTPPRALALPGSLAEISDSSLGGAFRAKITGWRLSAKSGEAAVDWSLERSV